MTDAFPEMQHRDLDTDLNQLSRQVIGAALHVHRNLGPGLLERVYAACLTKELGERGLRVEREVTLPITYRGEVLEDRFRLDILVEEQLVVEVKAVETVLPVHLSQLYTYLKLADRRLGVLLNFHAPLLREGGIHRVVNTQPAAPG